MRHPWPRFTCLLLALCTSSAWPNKLLSHPVYPQELLGHCLALYQSNRSAIAQLEAHLGQYGYTPPPGLVREPGDPLAGAAARRAVAGESRVRGCMVQTGWLCLTKGGTRKTRWGAGGLTAGGGGQQYRYRG